MSLMIQDSDRMEHFDKVRCGEPFGAVVCGWSLPPLSGNPKRFHAALRYTRGDLANKLWNWEGAHHTSRTTVSADQAASIFAYRPPWARALDLSAPHPFVFTAAGQMRPTWFRGLSAHEYLSTQLPSQLDELERILGRETPLELVVIDDESTSFFEPWKSIKHELWLEVLDDPRLPTAPVSRDWLKECGKAGAKGASEYRLTAEYNEWLDFCQTLVSTALRDFAAQVRERWPSARLVGTNHHMRKWQCETAGSWIAPVIGNGSLPDNLAAVKVYGRPGTIFHIDTDWQRLVGDLNRIASHKAISRRPVFWLPQCNSGDAIGNNANLDPQWWFSPRGKQVVEHAAIATGMPAIVSQKMRPDPKNGFELERWEAYVPHWQRAIEGVLSVCDIRIGGMGSRPRTATSEDVKGAEVRTRSMTTIECPVDYLTAQPGMQVATI